MNRVSKLVWFAAFGLLVSVFAAATAAAQAIVVQVNGPATIVRSNGTSVPATKGASVLEGDRVVTSAGGEVYLEVFAGAVATVKENSSVRLDKMQLRHEGAPGNDRAADLFLDSGTIVSVLDPNAKKNGVNVDYHVKTTRGVAAARGTAFSVTATTATFSVTATADAITFSPVAGMPFQVRAGQVTYTPPGATEPVTEPLAVAVQNNPQIAQSVRDAVSAVSTVVQGNLGSMTAEATTNLVSQVAAVAAGALPAEAAALAAQVVAAVTSPGSPTGGSAEAAALAAGAVTAAAVQGAPGQAAQIAGAAAQAAAAYAGVITAAAQQTAPAAKDAIAQRVAAATGQSVSTVQSTADASATAAAAAVNAANNATSNIVPPPAPAPTPTPETSSTPTSTPTTPVDLAINVSPSS